VVFDGLAEVPIAGFTVKREMISYLRNIPDRARPDWVVQRLPDGDPTRVGTWFKIEDLFKGV